MTPPPDGHRQVLVTALGLGILGAALVLWGTPRGIGTSPDTATYVSAARNMIETGKARSLASDGSLQPLRRHPPLYPALIGLPSFFGVDPLSAARWIGAASLAASVVLVIALLGGATRSPGVCLIGGLLFLLSPDVLFAHLRALSDAPFIVFLLAALLGLIRSIERPRWAWVVLAGAATSLACLTRDVGVALIATGALGLTWLGNTSLRARRQHVALFVALGSMPWAAWRIHTPYATSVPGGLPLAWHPPDAGQAKIALTTVIGWLFPGVTISPGWVLVVVAVALGAALASRLSRSSRGDSDSRRWPALHPLVWLLTISGGTFLACVLLALSWVSAQIPLDGRILLPVFVSVLVSSLCEVHRRLPGGEGWAPWWRRSALILGAFLVLAEAISIAPILRQSRKEGIGYTNARWVESPLMRELRRFPSEKVIYSNAPDAIFLHTGRAAAMVPRVTDPHSLKPDPQFETDVARMLRHLEGEEGIIAWFAAVTWRGYLLREEDLLKLAHMREAPRTQDGAVYELMPGLTAAGGSRATSP